ncbi:MAG: aldo/keto reductase [Clostridia bacterium]|nr:aldo/keto reductase [Clostridia bacterium]
MQYKILGKTGLKVSVIGFGGIPIQRLSMDEAKKVIWKAEEMGINFIDTARGYTISEEYIGEALKGRRNQWIIATKSMARDEESMAKDIETSLRNLQTEYVDLYQMHNVKTQAEYDKVFGEGGAYAALLKAKEQGKIRHIGASFHDMGMMKFMMENTAIESVMYPYNIVETQAKELFERAAELDVGVIAMKPMAGGSIEDGSLGMKFILGNEHITTAIPGMASIEEVEANAAAGNGSIVFTSEEERKIEEITESLGSEFCRRCGYCAPCPQEIDIPTMFLLVGYKKRYDLGDWAEARYSGCKKHAEDCIECGSCEPRCPYNLPVRKMMADVKAQFGR